MGFFRYNTNPSRNLVGDCTVRAIATVTGTDWDTAYWGICLEGAILKDMPSSNAVWGSYLRKQGFLRYSIPNMCPDCYTVRDFCMDFSDGIFLLATGSHIVAVVDGDYYDTWDSGDEIPIYYWEKENH